MGLGSEQDDANAVSNVAKSSPAGRRIWRSRVATEESPLDQRTALDELSARVRVLGASVDALRADNRRLLEQTTKMHAGLMEVAQLALDDEAATRRLLDAARSAPDYERPFTEAAPLVSVCIPTYTNHAQLVERAIPSALDQDYSNVEVVVVGDAAPAETAASIERLADARVRYENLSVRGPYPDDARARWLVAGTGPLNRSMTLARGSWIAILNDDDALRPRHVSSLLEVAQASHNEVVYGRLQQHAPDGSTELLGAFPPASHDFGWQLALQHRAMRLFEWELAAALFGEPGDWHRARRMMRAGVRFSMIDQIVCDYYPSTLWRAE
jgi:hypothetical protein